MSTDADAEIPPCAVPGCSKPAVMDSPADLCEEHWTNWMEADCDDGDEALARLLAGEEVPLDPRWSEGREE